MKFPRLAVVEWEDAGVDDDVWVSRTDPPAARPCIHHQVGWLLVGWLLEITKEHVLMTCTVSEKLYAGRTRIPRKMVRKITYLRKPVTPTC